MHIQELLDWSDSIISRNAEGLVLPTKKEMVSWVKEAFHHMDAQDVCYLLGVAEGIKHRDKKRR